MSTLKWLLILLNQSFSIFSTLNLDTFDNQHKKSGHGHCFMPVTYACLFFRFFFQKTSLNARSFENFFFFTILITIFRSFKCYIFYFHICIGFGIMNEFSFTVTFESSSTVYF